MLTRQEYTLIRAEALEYFKKAQIVLTPQEIENFEVSDFGLSRIREIGLELVTYVNTERCCAKDLILLPGQICPEHTHPPVDNSPGKEETFRCRWGTVYLYVPGTRADDPLGTPPIDLREYFTVWHEIILNPGEQYTLSPNTSHWFQAGPEGAIVSEFSTRSTDENDIFLDPSIERITKITD